MSAPETTIAKLPDFCRSSIVSMTVIACVLLAFLMAFFEFNWRQTYWFNLSRFSIFNLWTALSSIGLLCLVKKRFADLSLSSFSMIAIATCTLVSIVFTLLLQLALTEPVSGWLLFRNGTIAFIVSGLFFRYYFLQQQSLMQIQSEAEARIQALQSRIRPHFLFNSLNTIANLATQDPAKTEETILDLADIFRASMQRSDKLIAFADEQLLCKQYLHLEQQRLGDKLQFNWQTNTIDPQISVPPLLLQPIIENAVYHGVQNRQDGGLIEITGISSKNHIQIEVTNPLPTSNNSLHKGNSLALKNIRQRLEVLYQGRAELNYHSSGDTFYCKIKLPKTASLNFEDD